MNTKNRPAIRRLLVVGCLGIVMVMVITACAGFTGVSNSDEILRLNDGIVEMRGENGNWVPVAGDATFELVGTLESTDPWTVAGKTVETNETTQIEEGQQEGNLVRVKGVILEDGTWLAYSIELAEEQADPIIVLIGKVDSVDPWVVNGMTLNVTDETDIQGNITPGMIVRVEILPLADGTWQVLSIAPLGELAETPGCVTVIATVLSVKGNEILFAGWPTPLTLVEDTQPENDEGNENSEGDDEEGEDNDENEDEDNGNESGEGTAINAGDIVSAVVCVSDDGTIVVVQIIVLNAEEDGDTSGGGEKVLVCHNIPRNPHTINIASAAVPAHLAHGDTLGPCP